MDETTVNLATDKVRVNIWNEEEEVDMWIKEAKEEYSRYSHCSPEVQFSKSRYNLAGFMKDHYIQHNPLSEYQMVYSDLLGWALACVDWNDIAEGFIEYVIESK